MRAKFKVEWYNADKITNESPVPIKTTEFYISADNTIEEIRNSFRVWLKVAFNIENAVILDLSATQIKHDFVKRDKNDLEIVSFF